MPHFVRRSLRCDLAVFGLYRSSTPVVLVPVHCSSPCPSSRNVPFPFVNSTTDQMEPPRSLGCRDAPRQVAPAPAFHWELVAIPSQIHLTPDPKPWRSPIGPSPTNCAKMRSFLHGSHGSHTISCNQSQCVFVYTCHYVIVWLLSTSWAVRLSVTLTPNLRQLRQSGPRGHPLEQREPDQHHQYRFFFT